MLIGIVWKKTIDNTLGTKNFLFNFDIKQNVKYLTSVSWTRCWHQVLASLHYTYCIVSSKVHIKLSVYHTFFSEINELKMFWITGFWITNSILSINNIFFTIYHFVHPHPHFSPYLFFKTEMNMVLTLLME